VNVQAQAVQHLRCPVCSLEFVIVDGGVSCRAGHRFDFAHQGYLNLLGPRSNVTGDSAEMISARAQFLGAGHYAPLADALVEFACQSAAPGGLLMEVGAGTAYYLARLVESLPDSIGLAIDLSKYAARRAAKVHARVASIVADVWDCLPVAGESSGLTLEVFAPRQPPELHRTLRRDGTLLVVIPEPGHLVELRPMLHLLDIEPGKASRLAREFEPYFQSPAKKSLSWTMSLTKPDVATLVAMGPSARHLDQKTLADRIAGLPDPVAVTAAVTIHAYRRT
jgi:23S rRNA (guanine745-N1)-methyltransferase